MIKLVATDMDGTLLNDKKEMPETTFETIRQLHQRGIVFAVASGRQHNSLTKLYDEIKEDILIIAGNGSIIFDKGDIIFTSPMDKGLVEEIVAFVNHSPKLKITLCGLHADYMFKDNVTTVIEPYLVESHFPKRAIIKDLSELPVDEQIIQLAIFDEDYDSKTNIYEPLKHLSDKCHLAVSANQWLDVMNKGVNKGSAIKKIQNMLKISPEETMVFGDHLNDLEMMKEAKYSYAMDNAIAEIKAVSNFVAPSNEDAGVIKVLTDYLSKN